MKKIYLLSLATVATMPTALMAEIPEGYYDNLKGLSGRSEEHTSELQSPR